MQSNVAPPVPSRLARWLAGTLILAGVAGATLGLAGWKQASRDAQAETAASQPEPSQAVTSAVAGEHEHVRTTTSIGTVLALRSISLEIEVPGTVREVHLPTGEVVEAGTVLIALDVSVEEAELRAQEAGVQLAEAMLGRFERAGASQGASEADIDRARAELDVAQAGVARTRAVIERKTIRAPFRARVGMADVHPGQYLDQGSKLTTLQGVDEAVHVDFTVVQDIARRLKVGDEVSVLTGVGATSLTAVISALDARVDPKTRNAFVRARLEGREGLPAPGASVRVQVPTGAPRTVVVVPVHALRRGPAGDHVFVLAADANGDLRAHERRVSGGPALGDEVVIEAGLRTGERVATSGSFKLFEGALVAVVDPADASASAE